MWVHDTLHKPREAGVEHGEDKSDTSEQAAQTEKVCFLIRKILSF